MKGLFRKPVCLTVFLILIYCLGLTLGTVFIYSYSVYKHRPYFLTKTRAIAQEYCAGTDVAAEAMSGPHTHILFFDTEGTCIRHVYPVIAQPNYELNIALERDLSAALGGKEVFRPKFTGNENVEIITCVPIGNGDSITGAVFLIREIMDLDKAAEAFLIFFTIVYWVVVIFLLRDVRRKRKYEELRQNYIANVTHALKAPIASVKALTEALSDVVEPDPDKQRTYYGMILRETNIQSHMVQEILALSKLQSKGIDFTKTSVHACECFGQILDKYATLCDCAGISFHVAAEISQLPALHTNAACIQQVLEILLENAVKYVNDGDGIWVNVTTAKNQAIFCVKDNGVGISREDLPHVFERFYKCNRQRNESGSGLGLAIAKETLDGLKEKIWVESEPGKGAAFFFTVQIK